MTDRPRRGWRFSLSVHLARRGAAWIACAIGFASACGGGRVAPPPSNDLLIVGYDREPDTLNRFSPHILEDVQTCVIEGLTTTDEQMNVVPVLAEEVPTLANGGVRLRGDGGMDVTWLLRPGLTWDDGLRIEIRYNSGEEHNRLAVATAAMWKEALGVETTLYAEEFRTLLQSIQARTDTQVFRSSWVGDYNDAYSFGQLLQTGISINLTGYSNPRYDALLESATRQPDALRRRALLEEGERLMLSDHPVLPLYFYVNKHLVKPYVAGWTDNVMNVQYSKDLRLGGTS